MKKEEMLKKVIREYDTKKGIAQEKRNKETEKAYLLCPELLEIDKKINELGLDSMRKILSDRENAKKLKDELEKELSKLNKKRQKLILENNINPDYNKPVFECELCGDSGYKSDSTRCECFERRLKELYSEKSQMGKMLDGADFSAFSLDYYSDKKDKNESTPREIVKDALDVSKEFCKKFNEVDYNLFFYGKTGLGKTFLSSIIAKNVLDMGYSVQYVRATKVFSLYEDYKFKDYTLKPEIDDLYTCDLLVIDDLGTECATKNSVSFLFDLINDRLINGKKIIINTNLDINSFSQNYTVRLTSRIYENFKVFAFLGEDIRIQKLIKG